MVSISIIVFREVLEIALILGVVLVATRGLHLRGRWIAIGILGGIGGSALVAYGAGAISEALSGMGQEVFNASVLFLAALLIVWTVVWMKRHSQQVAKHVKAVSNQIIEGKRPLFVIAIIVALSVLREGSEVVLMTYGVMVSGGTFAQLVLGGSLGLVAGSLAGAGIYFGLIKLSTRYFFTVTSVLLSLLAAGMVSHGVHLLSTAGFIPFLVSPLWDSSVILSERGILGSVLHTLVGYTSQPSGFQLMSYMCTLGIIALLIKRYAGGPPPARAGVTGARAGRAIVSTGLLIAACVWLSPAVATATKKVYSPMNEYRELEIEARGNYNLDGDPDKDGAQKHKYAVGYGLTQRLFLELYGEFEKSALGSFEFEALELEGRYQVFEQGERWLDLGLYLAYELPLEDSGIDKVEFKLLLQKEFGRIVHMTNLELERELGSGASDEVEAGLAWSSRLRWRQYLEPGLELHSGFGELISMAPAELQQHRLGPVCYGKAGNFKYDIGYLFGLTDATTNGMFKWIVEYEISF